MPLPGLDRLTGLARQHKLSLAAGGLVVFAVALIFLDWFASQRMTAVTDSWWIVLVIAGVAAAWYLSQALEFTLPITGITAGRAFVAVLLVFFWTTTYLIDLPARSVGVWVGFVGAGAALLGAWLVAHD